MNADTFLGYTVRDRITRVQGICTGYTKYISGCNQVLIQPGLGADGKMQDHLWTDEQRVEICDVARVVLDNSKGSGFDAAAPAR